MTASLDDLVKPLTKEQIIESIYGVLAAVGVSTTTWKPGAVVRTMIVAVAIVLAALSRLLANVAKSGFLELATGAWLTLVARYVYGVERLEATFAEGEVTLVNTGGGVYSGDAEDLVVATGTPSRLYRNTQPYDLGAGETITIAVRAVEAGSASTAQPGAINRLETTLLGVTCSNALPLVGLNEELDAALRVRCNEKLGALSPMGPWDAYSAAARNAKTSAGLPAGVTRTRIVKDGAGGVTTYVASASGAIVGDEDDTSTALGAVNDAVQRFAAPQAITAIVRSATPRVFDVTYQVWAYNTLALTPAQLVALCDAKVLAFMSAQPIGGALIDAGPPKLYRDALLAAISSVRPEIFHAVVTLPETDQDLALSEVPVAGSVTGVATLVAPSDGF